MGYYLMYSCFLRIIKDYIEVLGDDSCKSLFRYDTLLNHVIEKNTNSIFGFRYGSELKILIKIIQDSGYIKVNPKYSVLFDVVKTIPYNKTLECILSELPYKLTPDELERITIGLTDSNYSDWLEENMEILKNVRCGFIPL